MATLTHRVWRGESCLAAARYAVEHDVKFYDVPLGYGQRVIVQREGNRIKSACLVMTSENGASFPGRPMTHEQLKDLATDLQRLATFPLSTLQKYEAFITMEEGTDNATEK